jgi:hypothetical protein
MHHSDRAGAALRPLTGLVLPIAGVLALCACTTSGTGPTSQGDDHRDDGHDACEGGGCLAGQDESPGAPPSATYESSGEVAVTLHPGPGAELGSPTVVSFGAPFPPGALEDAAALRAFDGATELKIHSEEILPWRAWPGRAGASPSVRAALVSIEVSFADREPKAIELRYGSAPEASLPAPDDPRADWVAVTDGEYPDGTVREPRVYATFPAQWLGDCQLRTRTTPVGSDPAWDWFDESMVGSAHTAVNDVPDAVSELVPYTSDSEPWLFDRTATLFGVYARTGDVKWLRHAHRSAQFYVAHVDGDGFFDLKEDQDLKYGYGRSLLMDYQMTGDPELIETIERIAAAGASWDPTYDVDTNFWTERHQTYALLAALSAWEATGDEQHAERAREVADTSFAMAADPAGSWHDDGCMLHGMTAHEGAGGDVPVCSPWMSALFADAVWEYYWQTEDAAAVGFLADLARYVDEYGLYDGGEGVDFTLPWYLASSEKTFSDDGPWGDVEHTCDVAGLVARGAWAEKQRGGDSGPLRATAEKLIEGCAWNLDSWHRPNGPDSGKSEWRLSPPRKFNWWFGTTSDLPWLMEESA